MLHDFMSKFMKQNELISFQIVVIVINETVFVIQIL